MEKENIVKEVCKELNITQKELSEILGGASYYYSKMGS
ncbi:helix-turn-helix transcriptional regulator [Campylobacter jejuni]|nr:helix-turn-helix transcriptional regulator [Campylobacter jejuni]